MKMTDLKIGTRLYIGFGLIAAILIILVSIAYTNFHRLSTANGWNTHTYVVRGELDHILESLVNIETGQRGFSLTGNDASLEPLNAGLTGFKSHLAKAKELTADNPAQQERLNKLGDAQQRWMSAAITPALDLRRAVRAGSEPIDKVLAFEQAGNGKREMDGMRALLQEIDNNESGLLEVRATEAANLQALTGKTLILGGLLAVALAVALSISPAMRSPPAAPGPAVPSTISPATVTTAIALPALGVPRSAR